jgi:hypothetical protein
VEPEKRAEPAPAVRKAEPPKEPSKEPPKENPVPEQVKPPLPAEKIEPKTENNTSLGKQVVISRGTQINAVLDNAYDYDSVHDGMRVTLWVEAPLERSGAVVIKSGAKVDAVIHKSARKHELELEILEIESVTGKRLKSMNTSYKASAFKKGEKFKINLDWHRLN